MNDSKDDIMKRYPFHGRTKYLIDKFLIIGYEYKFLYKKLIKDSKNNNNSNNTDRKGSSNSNNNNNQTSGNDLNFFIGSGQSNKSNFENSEIKKLLHSFKFSEFPVVLNDISSDYNKNLPDIETILKLIFPSNVKLYYHESDKNEKVIKSPKSYSVIFSLNPQIDNNSKKSVNGYAQINYKRYPYKKVIGNKIYNYFIPSCFCIISEFPFYNSFNILCNQIFSLFNSKKIEVPIEIILYNIVNFSLSPINGDLVLNIEPISFPFSTKLSESSSSNNQSSNSLINLQEVKENEQFAFIDSKNEFCIIEKNKEASKIKQDIDNVKLYPERLAETINPLKANYRMTFGSGSGSESNSTKEIKDLSYKKAQSQYFGDNNTGRTTMYNKTNNLVFNQNSPKKSKISNQNQIKGLDCIKFNFLPGYPLIQYNLIKILLANFSPQDVIIIFMYSFLEKDILFFSKNIEYLSLTINSYINLNFPLNDGHYYFYDVCVSYNNYINSNSTFVGMAFSSMLGICDEYTDKYINQVKFRLNSHLAVDLDNGEIHEKLEDDKRLFNFIKRSCESKGGGDSEKTILQKEIRILYERLSEFKEYFNIKNLHIDSEFNQKIVKGSLLNYDNENEPNTNNNILNYDTRFIQKKNKEIQGCFYRFVLYLCFYFYENLSLRSTETKSKDNKEKGKNQNNTNEEDYNVIFNKKYNNNDDGRIYKEEEILFLEELRQTTKFQSFVFSFVQSYNPIDLFKIPLTFIEEFLSILSRKKNEEKCSEINFFYLFDTLYKRNPTDKIFLDFNPFLLQYYKYYKNYFDREIQDLNIQFFIKNQGGNIMNEDITLRYCFNDGLLKYSKIELDNRILLKYINFIKKLPKDSYYHIFHLAGSLDQNILKNIKLTDIENEIERYFINIDVLTENDVCCVNIILTFILSIKSSIDISQSLLCVLFRNFTIFRKYYAIIMQILYRLINDYVNQEKYEDAQNFLMCYYQLLNNFMKLKLVPNEGVMKIINNFNKINFEEISEKINQKKENESDQNLDEGNSLKNIFDEKFVHLSYNFSRTKILKEDYLIEKSKTLRNKSFLTFNLSKGGKTKTIVPKITFHDGDFNRDAVIYSQYQIREILREQFFIFYKNLNVDDLDIEKIFDACLNIHLFVRNNLAVFDKDGVIETIEPIFTFFLHRMIILTKKDKKIEKENKEEEIKENKNNNIENK